MASETSAFNRTPHSERLHIVLLGRRNVGKSSLINAITGQHTALVSDVPGTTTDPVLKAMEILPLGPCVLIDTAGWDDTGRVGELRKQRTIEVLRQADIALLVTDGKQLEQDAQWAAELKRRGIPTLTVLNKCDLMTGDDSVNKDVLAQRMGTEVVAVSALNGTGMDALRNTLARLVPDNQPDSLTGKLAHAGDTVLLVMPQDPQAPRGRLILPQVQTLRDLLDKGCTALCCTTADMGRSLQALREPPSLVITDSQVFAQVEAQLPAGSRLTSFSVLMAAHKGDIGYMAASAVAIDRLTPMSRVLIAEACTHAPLPEDIGREKIPAMLRRRVGGNLLIDVVAGKDFPDDLSPYDLVIHCGACMFNRQFMLSRINQARQQGVPMTNYGIAIAHIKGILSKVSFP